MAAQGGLSASAQQVLTLACEAFSDVTYHYRAEPNLSTRVNAKVADAAIRFSISGKQFDMPVAVLRNPVSNGAAVVLHRSNGRVVPGIGRRLMLVTPHVSRKLADDLIARGIAFLDTAGNVYLDEPEATIMIVGRDKPALTRTARASRSTTPKGLRVMFALATQPALAQQPYRTIAKAAGVALNTVNLAMDDLIARGFVVQRAEGRVIANRERLIEDWVSLYPARLRPKLAARRFTSQQPMDWWQGPDLADLDARLGGESAAESLTHEIKPASVTVYAHGGVTPRLMTAARLRPDDYGDVEVLEAFWPQEAEPTWNLPQPGVVHPLLVYADLIASGDSRNHAVAQTLYDRFLADASL
jgi:hypothetical protein